MSEERRVYRCTKGHVWDESGRPGASDIPQGAIIIDDTSGEWQLYCRRCQIESLGKVERVE